MEGATPQMIELCCMSISNLEGLAEWARQFRWADLVRVPGSYDTFREQTFVPNPQGRRWTQQEFDDMIEDLELHPDVASVEGVDGRSDSS